MITVIPDTSVLISVLISRGKSFARDIITLAYDKKIQLLTCSEAFIELQETVKSEKVKKFKTYNSRKIGSFITWYKYNAQHVDLDKKTKSSITSRDSKDNIYLQLAETTHADFLVTVDYDLLTLKKIKKTKIATPEDFMKVYKTTSD